MTLVGFGIAGASITLRATAVVAHEVAAAVGPESAAAGHALGVAAHPMANPSLARIGPHLAPTPGLRGSAVSMAPGCTGTACPMGITDYGLTPSLGTYTVSPNVVESFWDINSLAVGVANGGGCLDPNAASGECFTMQQNAITHNMYVHGNKGSYWTQNVPELAYDASCSSPCVSGEWSLTWLDNIWNFSYSGGYCPSGLSGGLGCLNSAYIHGDKASACSSFSVGPTFYYCVGPTIYGLLAPFTVYTWTDVQTYGPCVSGNHTSCVNFYGEVVTSGGAYLGSGYYDGVSFASGSHRAGSPTYYIANSLTPTGLPYDFEWVAGGPGGGSSVDVLIVGTQQSFTCSKLCPTGGAVTIKHAWSSGSDTAESVTDVYVISNFFGLRDIANTYYAADDGQTSIW